ncbi:hypothetical protein Syun_010166 [Stephania yunnanensis]|uniref:Uncharacterized protein n=1 Tax=Stephania yunnanensis TaxID=152371 RepID=A0AAP0KG13_9MAGN
MTLPSCTDQCDNVGDCGVFGNSGTAWISTCALEMRELFKFNSASRIVQLIN